MENIKRMKSIGEKKCKVCGDKTKTIFNIEFKATPICESCATSIFIQQADWYSKPKPKQ
jgi:hypothetical protein